ncbi:hypothetical protein Q3G72_034468 [Acer saccharum]|nr:hypothetical protein Q3G72_034468 [Acer saccharum]
MLYPGSLFDFPNLSSGLSSILPEIAFVHHHSVLGLDCLLLIWRLAPFLVTLARCSGLAFLPSSGSFFHFRFTAATVSFDFGWRWLSGLCRCCSGFHVKTNPGSWPLAFWFLTAAILASWCSHAATTVVLSIADVVSLVAVFVVCHYACGLSSEFNSS